MNISAEFYNLINRLGGAFTKSLCLSIKSYRKMPPASGQRRAAYTAAWRRSALMFAVIGGAFHSQPVQAQAGLASWICHCKLRLQLCRSSSSRHSHCYLPGSMPCKFSYRVEQTLPFERGFEIMFTDRKWKYDLTQTARRVWALFPSILVAAILVCLLGVPCQAQVASFTETDIQRSGSTVGSYSYNGTPSPPQYTVEGAGYGLLSGYGTHSFGYAYVPTSGNVELEAKLLSESSSEHRCSGRVSDARFVWTTIRQMAAIALSVNGTVNFYYQTPHSDAVQVVTGPSSAAPIYLRLARNGNTISGLVFVRRGNLDHARKHDDDECHAQSFLRGLHCRRARIAR